MQMPSIEQILSLKDKVIGYSLESMYLDIQWDYQGFMK